MKLRLGTRGSDLALTQSRWVASALAGTGVETELVVISTSGDQSTAPTFGAIGPQGVFVREIEQALLENEIDLAVHSFKDLPTESPSGLAIAAVPTRRDPADSLLYRRPGKRGQTPFFETPLPQKRGLTPLSELAQGARVGTASARRQAWLTHFRPDLEVVSLRGNVPTRLRRLAEGDFDAILLAGAGIERLNESSDVLDAVLAGIERRRLDPERFVPAPAQGALAIQCRAGNNPVLEALAVLDDAATRTAVELERRALALAEGGCDTAFGAFARSASADTYALSVMAERNGRIAAGEVIGRADTNLEAAAIEALAHDDRSTA